MSPIKISQAVVKSHEHTNISRLSKTTIQKINEQIAHENHASFHYLQMASWCEKKGYDGAAALLQRQSADERMHMLKLIAYLHEMDVMPHTPSTPAIEASYSSLKEVFLLLQKHERQLTSKIHTIVAHALAIQDFTTFQFLQWFVTEQREEELLAKKALDLFELINPEAPLGLFHIDQALGKLKEVNLA
jgi:ferritin